jgi:hypothetical protein
MDKEYGMQIQLNLPEEVARTFGNDAESVGRATLEALALQGIRSCNLSRGQVRRLLGFQTRYEVDGFLKTHGIPIEESLDDIDRDGERVLSFGLR